MFQIGSKCSERGRTFTLHAWPGAQQKADQIKSLIAQEKAASRLACSQRGQSKSLLCRECGSQALHAACKLNACMCWLGSMHGSIASMQLLANLFIGTELSFSKLPTVPPSQPRMKKNLASQTTGTLSTVRRSQEYLFQPCTRYSHATACKTAPTPTPPHGRFRFQKKM